MLRDPARLQRHADLVAADLARTFDGAWTADVSADWVFRVEGPSWQGVAELDADVDEDVWPTDEGDAPDAALDDDASAAVTAQAVELICNTGVDWPVCSTHGSPLETAGSRWTCPTDGHDVAEVGRLGLTV